MKNIAEIRWLILKKDWFVLPIMRPDANIVYVSDEHFDATWPLRYELKYRVALIPFTSHSHLVAIISFHTTSQRASHGQRLNLPFSSYILAYALCYFLSIQKKINSLHIYYSRACAPFDIHQNPVRHGQSEISHWGLHPIWKGTSELIKHVRIQMLLVVNFVLFVNEYVNQWLVAKNSGQGVFCSRVYA